jgi:hypothetical protein
MSEPDRKRLLVELESELRRAGTALAVAQADYEKAYTAVYQYMSEHTDGPQRMLAFSPGVTVH